MPEPGTLTWRSLWLEAAEALGDPNEARWICEEASGRSGVEWLTGLEDLATQRAVARVDALVARRRAGEPIQYVLGSWAFRTVTLMVDRRVLIPRPETELVAEAAIELARRCAPTRVVVDLGTGTGAIALACAAELPLDGTQVWATDVSADALDVARANLAGLGRGAANVRIVQGSWFAALPDELRGRVDVIVSNPPYIADDDPEVADAVREWEPAGALFAGDDGLAALREIISGAGEWLRPGGSLVLEIGHLHGAAVRLLLRGAGFIEVEIRPDLARLDRIAIARR
jgi:release factor glutamine methyltransferase